MKEEDREKIKKLLPNNYDDFEKENMTNSLIELAEIYLEMEFDKNE